MLVVLYYEFRHEWGWRDVRFYYRSTGGSGRGVRSYEGCDVGRWWAGKHAVGHRLGNPIKLPHARACCSECAGMRFPDRRCTGRPPLRSASPTHPIDRILSRRVLQHRVRTDAHLLVTRLFEYGGAPLYSALFSLFGVGVAGWTFSAGDSLCTLFRTVTRRVEGK